MIDAAHFSYPICVRTIEPHRAPHHSSRDRHCHLWTVDLELGRSWASLNSRCCQFLAVPVVCKLPFFGAAASPGTAASSRSKACHWGRRCEGARDDELEVARDSSKSKVAQFFQTLLRDPCPAAPCCLEPRTLDFRPRTLDFRPPDLAVPELLARCCGLHPSSGQSLFIHFWMTAVPIWGG